MNHVVNSNKKALLTRLKAFFLTDKNAPSIKCPVSSHADEQDPRQLETGNFIERKRLNHRLLVQQRAFWWAFRAKTGPKHAAFVPQQGASTGFSMIAAASCQTNRRANRGGRSKSDHLWRFQARPPFEGASADRLRTPSLPSVGVVTDTPPHGPALTWRRTSPKPVRGPCPTTGTVLLCEPQSG